MRTINFLYRISAIFIILLLFSSCPNDEIRDLVEVKVSDPVADSFIINSGAPTSSLSVTLYSNVTKEDDALEMRFRNESGTWSDWTPYSSSASWDLSIGDGIKTVYAEYRDEGHHVVSMDNSITLDTGAPVGEGFYVWGTGPVSEQHDWVNSSSVPLVVSVTGANRMRFSNTSVTDSIAAWDSVTPSVPYTSVTSWTLSSGDGSKTIYAQFIDSADNASYYNYTIILDTTAPAVSSFQINSDDATANNTGATLTYSYTETNSLRAEYRNDGGSWSSSESLSSSPVTKSWALRPETGTRTVYARLTDIAGNISAAASDTIYLSTAAPAYPVVTASTPTSDTTPTWSWSTVTGAVSYNFSLDEGSWSNTTATTYTPGTALSYGNHTLSVTSIDIAGNESSPGVFTVNIVQPPDIPAGLAIGARTNSTLALSWNTSARADSYRLFRDTSSSGSFATQVYSGTSLSYTDTGLSSGRTYYYKVLADNSGGSSALSSSVGAPTIPATPSAPVIGTVTTSSIYMSWASVTGATSYQVYVSSSPTGTYVTQVYNGSSTGFTLSSLDQGRIYYFKVTATNSSGSSSQSSSTQTNTLLSVPTSFTVTKGTSTANVTVSWEYVSGANQYFVERRTLSGSFNALINISGNTYSDTSATAGVTYYYRVRARSADNVYSSYTSESGGYRGVAGGLPNLQLNLIFVSRTSTQVNIIYRINNNGNALADIDGTDHSTQTDNVAIQNYYSSDSVWGGDRVAGGFTLYMGLTDNFPVILPGEYYDYSYHTSGENSSGEYVFADLDIGDDVTESNEGDNLSSMQIP